MKEYYQIDVTKQIKAKMRTIGADLPVRLHFKLPSFAFHAIFGRRYTFVVEDQSTLENLLGELVP